eukprot:scaffold29649_cov47-Attheya_sp.AAC.4
MARLHQMLIPTSTLSPVTLRLPLVASSQHHKLGRRREKASVAVLCQDMDQEGDHGVTVPVEASLTF